MQAPHNYDEGLCITTIALECYVYAALIGNENVSLITVLTMLLRYEKWYSEDLISPST